MSQITQVVERIARYVERAKASEKSNPKENTYWGQSLPLEQASQLHYRLTEPEIRQGLANYPFYLPTELIELYRLGNGCLPARSPSTHNWCSPEDYFIFPDTQLAQLLTLSMSADFYRYDINLEWREKINRKMFPIIMGLERRFWCILGSERETLHGPILFYHSDAPEHTEFAFPSLTALLSSWIAVKEQQLKASDDKQIAQIVKRYGGTYDGCCAGMELLYYLACHLSWRP